MQELHPRISETVGEAAARFDVVAALRRVRPLLLSRLVIATGATTEPGVEALRREHALRVLEHPALPGSAAEG